MMRILKTGKLASAIALAAMAFSTVASAGTPTCVSLTTINSAVSENFDSLVNTGTGTLSPPWYMVETGANANLLYTAGTGSANTGDTYSFGAAAATDRALGGLLSGSVTPTFGACFVNNTGTTITSLSIAYTGEQWRLGTADANIDRLDFQYSLVATALTTGAFTDEDSLDFTGPTQTPVGPLDGNAAANRVAIASTIPTLAIAPASTFWIRWSDVNVGGSDDGLGIDDFSLTPNGLAPSTDLQITKTDSPDPVAAGANLTYTITLTNISAVAATTVAVDDNVPTGTTFVSLLTPAGWTCTAPAFGATGAISCTVPALAANASAIFTLVVAVPASTASGTVLSNTASATSATTDSNPANNTAIATTTVASSADLSLTLTDAPDPVAAGTNLVYTATVTNTGPSNAAGVAVTLPTPANTTFVSGSIAGGGTCTGGATITCTFTGPVLLGTPRAATITVAVAAATPNGTLINATASVTSTSTDPLAGNNAATATTTVATSANLTLTLTASATAVAIGAPVTFAATSTNNGPSSAQNVLVSITLSPDFRFSLFTASAGATCTTPQIGLSGLISCTWAGATAPGATRTLAVTAVSNSRGTSSVLASTSSLTTDPITTNNVFSQSVVVGADSLAIPVLDRYSLILLALMLGLLGFAAIRRQS